MSCLGDKRSKVSTDELLRGALGIDAVVAVVVVVLSWEVVVVVIVGVKAGEAEQAGGDAAELGEQEEQVQQQLGHLQAHHREKPHQYHPRPIVAFFGRYLNKLLLLLLAVLGSRKEGL
ncbi:unnamed protein product [Urochloa humidicola]